jgi:hypothetical protein
MSGPLIGIRVTYVVFDFIILNQKFDLGKARFFSLTHFSLPKLIALIEPLIS